MISNTSRRMAKAMSLLFWVSLGCLALVMSACETAAAPEAIPADLSPSKFFLKAQEMVDADNYDGALQYLNEFRKRYGASTSTDILDKYMEADYLTAQINYKRGNITEARAQYATLLAKFDGVPNDSPSPPKWIKILCIKLLEKIDAKNPKPSPKPADPAASPAPSGSPAPSPAPSPATK